MAWKMIDELAGAKLIEEAGYVFRKKSMSGLQHGGKIRLR